MNRQTTFFCFLVVMGSASIRGEAQRDSSRLPLPPGSQNIPLPLGDGVPVRGNAQRDSSRLPLPPGSQTIALPTTPSLATPPPRFRPVPTTTPVSTVQILSIPVGPALQLTGGIVSSVLAATRPRDPSPPPIFQDFPFSCAGRVPGYYADTSTNCRNFYTCSPRGRKQYHRCGERTIFNQLLLICDHRRNYDCRLAPQHYYINEDRRPFRD